MRGVQLDFVAGGTVSFLRLRKTGQHSGAQLEAWGWDRAVVTEPGQPENPTWVGMVGKDELLELAAACLTMLGRKDMLLVLRGREES